MQLQVLLLVAFSVSAQRWNFYSRGGTYGSNRYQVPYFYNSNDIGFKTNQEVKSSPQPTTVAPYSELCADPAYRDAPFCQPPRQFNKAGEKIPIFWKSRNIALSPIINKVGGSVQLRTYDAINKDQKWTLTLAREVGQLYFITNSESGLALTANAYPSTLTLQENIKADNQKFYVRPQADGSFLISTFGSDLYWDAIEVDSGSLPVLAVRSFEGDVTQKWILN